MKLRYFNKETKEWDYLEIGFWSFVKIYIAAWLVLTGIVYGLVTLAVLVATHWGW
jgi:hypothetical protein